MRISNGIFYDQMCTVKYPRCYIGSGNNSNIVKQVLSNRYWWTNCDSTRQSNLIWTSLKHKNTLKSLKPAKAFGSTRHVKKKQEDNFGFHLITGSREFKESRNKKLTQISMKIHNRIAGNKSLCTKKGLLRSLLTYFSQKTEKVFNIVPLTYHIKNKADFQKFKQENPDGSLWIIKPGEGTNRGHGIHLTNSFNTLQKHTEFSIHTYVIQKYIQNPLLYENRKFDVRAFGLVTIINGRIQGYYYKQGYIRTSSDEFSLQNFSTFIHLTNDAIQKKSPTYGKFQQANKISYSEIQSYFDFEGKISHQLKRIMKTTFKAAYQNLDSQRLQHTFQLFGYDFLIDQNLKAWLIQVNTNPCLQTNCELLRDFIPSLLDNTFRISIDPLFPPPVYSKRFQNWISQTNLHNTFELIFTNP